MENFEQQKNRKAFTYTLIICGTLLLLCFLVSWKVQPATTPPQTDQIEIDLGNLEEGSGDRLAGNPRNSDNTVGSTAVRGGNDAAEKVNTDPNAEPDAASANPKNTGPKITMPGSQNNNNGQDADDFNRTAGNGGGEGGRGIGNGGSGQGTGISVTNGNRRITKYQNLRDDVGRATIYAIIKVSPEGKGSFVSFEKGSSSRSVEYKNAIIRQLNNITFDNADRESIVTVKFNFNVN